MDGERRGDREAQRSCQRCSRPTKLLTILPKTTQNPTFWIYGCSSCGFVEWLSEGERPAYLGRLPFAAR
jgi:hypothetical protein